MVERPKKVCYYDLLGLDRKCDAAEVKAAYRKLALKMHPDKAHQNGLTVEEATRRFQEIQEAHSTLSDPQERAWYDAHREQILKGDDEPGEDPFKTKINLYRYFSATCYNGFGADANGFFAVYADLFQAIDQEEEEWEDADEDHIAMPPFGGVDAAWSDVAAFYRHWLDFCSRKAFGHADKWNPREAPNRQVRRAMEQENKKARQAAKKEFNAEVRQLVKFVQKRDPRVLAHQKEQMKEIAEKTAREAAQKEQLKAEKAKEAQRRKEAARVAEEERWAEAEAQRADRRARGEAVSEDESDESDERVEYRCEPCRKTFKSEKAYDAHARSKKHLQLVEKLRRELEREMEEEKRRKELEEDEEDEEDEDDDSDSNEKTSGQAAAQAPSKGSGSDAGSASGDNDDSDDNEDDDDFVARFAAARQKKQQGGNDGFSPPPRAGAEETDAATSGVRQSAEAEDEEEAVEAEEEEEAKSSDDEAASSELRNGSSKKAQKRAKQQALLLEKKAQRESVQELVGNCRKAQRAAREGAEGATDALDEHTEAAASAEAGEALPAEATPTCPPCRKPKKGAAAAGPAESTCAVCGEEFPSRSKLFQHIKETGHAVLKEAVSAEPQKGRKKKKR